MVFPNFVEIFALTSGFSLLLEEVSSATSPHSHFCTVSLHIEQDRLSYGGSEDHLSVPKFFTFCSILKAMAVVTYWTKRSAGQEGNGGLSLLGVPFHGMLGWSLSPAFFHGMLRSNYLILCLTRFDIICPRLSQAMLVELSCRIVVAVAMFLWRGNPHHDQENDAPQPESKINELKVAIGPLSGRSLQYCSDACLRRYLEARNWNVDKSKKMLEETLEWRSTYKPEEIRWHEIAIEGETGKVFRANFHDRNGRTVLILRPVKQNTKSLDNQIRHLVYLIENAIFNLPEGQEQMAWLIDFTGWSLSTNVPIKSARDTVNILQNHYPERLAVAILYNPPRIFEAFWKIVKYFLEAKTFQKVKFVYPKDKESVELMRSYFDVENLPTEFGGKATLEYDHEEFSRLMAQDDVKAASWWGFDENGHHSSNGYSGAEVAPEPVCLAPAAS
ncbi:hypothetical protein L1049_025648 [Liquidambar formosana]|uniref:CRAL-TRIO domain-containing protein n=1 Tax=Liquidambar formosana TaxID=63359 RepID=A0AAP0R6J6_LIQFO